MNKGEFVEALADRLDVSRAQAKSDTTSRLQTQAERLTAPVVVDGKLEEPVWQNGHAVTAVKQRDPHEGAAASLPTDVRVAYDGLKIRG